QTLGMKLFAAKGKVEIQAQSDNIEIIADKVMKLISAKESIEIAAKKEVLITSGGSYIRINAGGIEHGTLGFWKAHAGSHNLPGEKGLDYASPKMPKPAFSNRLDLYDILAGRDFSQIKYTAILDDKTVSSGTFDEHGRTARIFSNKQQNAKLLVSTGDNWAYSVKTEATLTNSIQFELKDFMGDPIKDLRYEFRTNGSVVKAGQFNGDKVNVTTSGTGVLELWVEKFPTQTLGLALNMTDIAGISEVSLISPKKVYKFELLPDGEKGDYWRGTYEVQDGETFASIAEKYGTTPISLLAMNSDIDDYSKPVYPALTKGQVIQVPPQSNRKS
ncbi:LysM peptidoglycan-binding domain-containing protein, partial [Hydromonas duriensis]